jgi:plastocyanin
MAFSPLDLHVPAGATVTVVNQDGIQHSVTSEASQNAFTKGAVGGVSFDTGPFTGTQMFTIPANAPTGTVIPYFCTIHLATMATPNGAITIDPNAAGTTSAPSAPSTPAPSSGGGGGMPAY